MIIIPYRAGSESARNIAEYLNGQGLRTLRSQKIPKPMARVVCWGTTKVRTDHCKASLNRLGTESFTNKLSFFRRCGDDPRVPRWTIDIQEARQWPVVVARQSISGKGGEGIVITESPSEPAAAPLYVKYEKKTDEYRIHVFKNRAGEFYIGHHQKKVAKDKDQVRDWKVRNWDNGFIFQQHGYDVPNAVSSASIGLVQDRFAEIDFVALDVIYHKPTDKAYVLEGNTAPGVEGHSVEVYGQFFKGRLYP